jgi:hypothetical protein
MVAGFVYLPKSELSDEDSLMTPAGNFSTKRTVEMLPSTNTALLMQCERF